MAGFQRRLKNPIKTAIGSSYARSLTSAAIPFIRITEKGYFRFRENDYVGI
jgi:hypothetical protein